MNSCPAASPARLVTIMKAFLIFIYLIFTQTVLYGQDNLWKERGSIIFQFENYPDASYQFVIVDSTAKISIGIYGEDSLEITNYIRPYSSGKFDDESLCDSVVTNLLCDSCVEFHIEQMRDSKERKWVKLSDSLFVSSKWVSKLRPEDKTSTIYTVPIMKITKKDSFTQIILYTERMTKEKWKALKNETVANTN